MSLLPQGPWPISKSGVRIDAGPVSIRMEAGASREVRQAIARLISLAPALLDMLRERMVDCDVGEQDPGCAWCLTTNGEHEADCRGAELLAKIEGES